MMHAVHKSINCGNVSKHLYQQTPIIVIDKNILASDFDKLVQQLSSSPEMFVMRLISSLWLPGIGILFKSRMMDATKVAEN